MEGLFTNTSSRQDFIINGIRRLSGNNSEVFIATAFFTYPDLITELLRKDCRIRLIVRLGYPTNPDALDSIIEKPGLEIRFFTAESFHPKIYIFGDNEALIGSANLTNSALFTNQEVMLSVTSEDDRLRELISLFSDYWEQAKVLTKEDILKYQTIYKKYSQNLRSVKDLQSNIKTELGKVEFENIGRGHKKRTKESIFIDSYEKAYQESLTAFSEIKKVYESTGYRKVPESRLPLRLEIDSFVTFVRDHYAIKETWLEVPVGWDNTKKQKLLSEIDDWQKASYSYLEDTIVNEKYPLILSIFGKEESIRSAEMADIVEALSVLHSFHDRLRFYDGGLETLKKEFVSQNNLEYVKDSLIYLLYGKGNIIHRMCDLIYNSDYKINVFGESNVQELVGWVNNQDLPVINGRTTKIFRYYGFDVKQL